VGEKFGTQIKVVDRETVLKAYEAVPETHARAEASRWMRRARKTIEPTSDEVLRSCRLALAFHRLMDEHKATVITTDCYGSMYHQLPAFPCIGNTRINDLGLAGICESDLRSAMTFILMQSLSGRPGFISDPTMDTSTNGIILAHCLGSTRMDGPAGPQAPYQLRSIMERQEGAVVQVFMRPGQKVTQAQFVGTDKLLYFTGTIHSAPDVDRGCRTQIHVTLDGDAESLWENWSAGLHRVTCYGDLTVDLQRFCRFKGIQMVDEASKRA
jgi:L-fucose isomerase-like protein